MLRCQDTVACCKKKKTWNKDAYYIDTHVDDEGHFLLHCLQRLYQVTKTDNYNTYRKRITLLES